MIPLFKVFMPDSVDKPLLETLHSGFIGEGPKVLEFENILKKYLQTENVLTTNSGTSALHLAYHIISHPKKTGKIEDLQIVFPKPKVLTSPITCTATNNPIINNQMSICWVDVDPITGNITPKTLKEACEFEPLRSDYGSYNKRAASIVHWGGNPCDIEEISKICKEHDIKLVEDGAHSLGMEYNEKPFGYYADFAMYSFQAIKHITTGDGGCLMCKSKEDYERAKLLRWYGIDRTIKEGIDLRCELDIAEAGYKFHMNDLAATIGIENFKYLEEIVAKHRDNAKFYNERFEGKIRYVPENSKGKSSYWLYTIHIENRDELMQKLKEEGIMTSKVHSRNDTHSMFAEFKRDLPGVEEFNRTHLCIPVGWWVTEEDREFIAKKVLEYAK